MELKQALALADNLVFIKTGKHLSTVEETIFRSVWLNEKYKELAGNSKYKKNGIKTSAYNFWKLLSQVLEEKINKANLKATLERIALKHQDSLTQNLFPKNQDLKAIPPIQPDNLPETIIQKEPSGVIPLESKLYIERPPIEYRCYQKILESGALIRIKAPREMGKSSLMTRIIHHASFYDYHTVYLNFRLAKNEILSDLDLLLKWLCASVGRKLKMPNQIKRRWDDFLGSPASCTEYFEDYLLAQLKSPLIIAFDNVDKVFSYPEVAEEFLALLRTWYEDAKIKNVFAKLRIILVYSTEIYIPLEIQQSPFNVGFSVELPEFSLEQIGVLAKQYKISWNPACSEQLMRIIGGHPYLVQLALYHIAHKNMSLEEILASASTFSGIYSEHLQRHLTTLEKQPKLVEAMKKVLSEKSSVQLNPQEKFKLLSMGLVRQEKKGIIPRYELYRRYFLGSLLKSDETWVIQS